MTYEKLLREAQHASIDVYEKNLQPTIKGLYSGDTVWINKGLSTSAEKACILAEELGHYHTSSGDIIDQRKLGNRKQEKRARNWAYEKLVPLGKIVQAYKDGVHSRHELSEYLDVIEDFLDQALSHYRQKYGLYAEYEHYLIRLEPLGIIEMLERTADLHTKSV